MSNKKSNMFPPYIYINASKPLTRPNKLVNHQHEKTQGTMLCALPPQVSPICKQCIRVHKTGFRRHGYFLGHCLCSIRLRLKLIAIHSIS